MAPMIQDDESQEVSLLIAKFLAARGVKRIFGLQGGHIQPIWHHLPTLGIEIIDVRDERAAVHMAQAHAHLTGELGVAMVTAGPGVTNTVTAVANAHIERTPVLVIGGCPPRHQINMGPLQDVSHTEIMRPITRQSRTARVNDQVLRELDEAVSKAFGDGASPGPVYMEIPADVLRQRVAAPVILPEHMTGVIRRYGNPCDEDVSKLANMIQAAERPVLVTGRGARASMGAVSEFLERTGCVHLDTQETKGLLPETHPSSVSSVRGRVMSEADLVIVLGRRLDYQLGYGSPAVWPNAEFARISDTPQELHDNRRGIVEILADVTTTIRMISDEVKDSGAIASRDWTTELTRIHQERIEKLDSMLAASSDGDDGKPHPNKIFSALRSMQLKNPIFIADGGDLLSFARIGAVDGEYMDSGAFGCLGVGVPYAIAAALNDPERDIVSVSGDGAFGFNAMEIDTAVRHQAKALFVVANNSAWNIERYDQQTNYGRVNGTELGDANYADLAQSLGAYGEKVSTSDTILPALQRALQNLPAVIEVEVTRDAVSSDATKGLGFVHDYQALTPWNDAEILRRQNSLNLIHTN